MKAKNLDRDGIKYLLSFYTQQDLCNAFGITPPTLRAYIRRHDPQDPSMAVARYINLKVADLRNRTTDVLASVVAQDRPVQHLPRESSGKIPKMRQRNRPS